MHGSRQTVIPTQMHAGNFRNPFSPLPGVRWQTEDALYEGFVEGMFAQGHGGEPIRAPRPPWPRHRLPHRRPLLPPKLNRIYSMPRMCSFAAGYPALESTTRDCTEIDKLHLNNAPERPKCIGFDCMLLKSVFLNGQILLQLG